MHAPVDLERRYASHELPAQNAGMIDLLVVRRGSEQHETPREAELSCEEGLIGDRWFSSGIVGPDLDKQLTLMMTNVARVICNGKPLDLPGDNLLVSIDLSVAALPIGARLHAGEALIEVTAKPHTGCKKFLKRFGPEALSWVNDDAGRARRLRGVNCRVIQPGVVRVGDTVQVVPR